MRYFNFIPQGWLTGRFNWVQFAAAAASAYKSYKDQNDEGMGAAPQATPQINTVSPNIYGASTGTGNPNDVNATGNYVTFAVLGAVVIFLGVALASK